jgi:hypothetical protein
VTIGVAAIVLFCFLCLVAGILLAIFTREQSAS